jgi:D-glycero-alpha-D-manno-heptose-7-phosphate kinase
MIISRTPYRISFFGGGTDYPGWYKLHGGQVLSASIDKYCYITLRYLPPFFEHKTRIVYSKIESVSSIDEIQHPAVREVLRYMNFDHGLEIHHDGDLPARSGMGSSSTFIVGLLNALYALKGSMRSKRQLAEESIYIEQELLGETVGSQDQTAAAFGGLNHILFHQSGDIEIRPVTLHRDRRQELSDHLMLFYTGIMRTASDVAKSYVKDIASKETLLRNMSSMVSDGVEILQSSRCICDFGELLDAAWQAKCCLSDKVSNGVVDKIIQRAKEYGAIGGKIAGAGGGGFLLLFVPPSAQSRVRNALGELLHVPFHINSCGSQIIFYDPSVDDFRHIEDERSHRNIQCLRELSSMKFRGETS